MIVVDDGSDVPITVRRRVSVLRLDRNRAPPPLATPERQPRQQISSLSSIRTCARTRLADDAAAAFLRPCGGGGRTCIVGLNAPRPVRSRRPLRERILLARYGADGGSWCRPP